MSGTTEYINAYIDVAVGTIHENLNTILQLKTESNMIKAIVASKDATIADLEKQLDSIKSESEATKTNLQSELDTTRNNLQSELSQIRTKDDEEIQQLRQASSKWENECNAMKNKVSNLEGIVNQFNDLKRAYVERETELNELKEDLQSHKKEIELLKSEKKEIVTVPKKVINTKNTVSKTVITPDPNDDF